MMNKEKGCIRFSGLIPCLEEMEILTTRISC